jgi:hypothetical protein
MNFEDLLNTTLNEATIVKPVVCDYNFDDIEILKPVGETTPGGGQPPKGPKIKPIGDPPETPPGGGPGGDPINEPPRTPGGEPGGEPGDDGGGDGGSQDADIKVGDIIYNPITGKYGRVKTIYKKGGIDVTPVSKAEAEAAGLQVFDFVR